MTENGTRCKFCGADEHLRDLDEELPEWWNQYKMVKVADRKKLPVRQIVGSVGNGHDYDPFWNPLTQHERDLEVLVSMMRRGFDSEESRSSPITLLKHRGEYFVESDGHRRMSVAHRLGLATVEAEVYELRDANV